ncbi:MAG: tetratricopeptide repeat protein, partial [Candidatus Binataceae bacterium]
GLDLWRSAQMKQAKGDQKGFLADAKLTALTYSYFADQVAQGKTAAKNLTGTLSILAQAKLAGGEVDEAEKIFDLVVKADAGSPDANAGLARIAQAKKDYRNAVELWTTVESVSNDSDNLWYEAKYNVAIIYLAQGRKMDGCAKFRGTRTEHPSLGSPEMLAKWNAAQRKFCLDGKGT